LVLSLFFFRMSCPLDVSPSSSSTMKNEDELSPLLHDLTLEKKGNVNTTMTTNLNSNSNQKEEELTSFAAEEGEAEEEGDKEGSGGVLSTLPKEILVGICLRLPNSSVGYLQSTSRFFHNLLLDDYFWKLKTLQQFPSAGKTSESNTRSWRDRYKRFLLWHWDLSLSQSISRDYLMLVGKNQRKVQNNSSGWNGVFGNFILAEGIHYWEIAILQQLPPDERTLGIGVATSLLDVEKSFFKSNWGIGYYNDGCVYDLGDELSERFPTFGKGDKIGVHIDFENGSLTYYLNRKKLSPPVSLALQELQSVELRPAVLFEHNKLKIRYFGSVVPK
jgi:hypothetical protein